MFVVECGNLESDRKQLNQNPVVVVRKLQECPILIDLIKDFLFKPDFSFLFPYRRFWKRRKNDSGDVKHQAFGNRMIVADCVS